MNFFTEIAILFRGMPPLAIVCLVVGLLFVIIEMFMPGFGIFGISGSVLLVAGIVFRVIVGDGNPLAQIFLMLFFLSIIITIAFIIMVEFSKKGWLRRTPLFAKDTAVGIDRSEGTADYGEMMDKEGVAATTLRPVGKARIEGKLYDVVSDNFVPQGERIKVIAVEGGKITVEKAAS